MKDLDLKSLRLFLSVCELGNIRQAAQEAHIEPSAISKRIAQLEAELGTPLLLRGRRGVQPTAAGQTLLEHARSLRFTLERLEADVAAHAGGVRGQVRLVASASAVAESLLDDVARFLRDPRHQGIRIDLEERLSVDVVRCVREGSASLGVCWDSVDHGGLVARPYREDELVLAVHPDHPLAGRARMPFSASLGHEHVGLPPATAVYQMLHRAAARSGQVMSYRIIVSTFDAAMRVVCANLGVSVIPLEVAQRYARTGEVVTVRLTDAWARRRFVVLSRETPAPGQAAERMAQHLADLAAEAPVEG